MIYVSLFDLSGNAAKPWLEAGYACWLFDEQHPPGCNYKKGGMLTFGGDIRDWKNLLLENAENIVFISAFPPCTHLASSGARWWDGKSVKDPEFQTKAMELVYFCRDIADEIGCAYYIENPIGRVSTLWRKPDYKYHPWQYTLYCKEDNYTKNTCLWTSDLFSMPDRAVLASLGPPDEKFIHHLGSSSRHSIGSITPMGFSLAVYVFNKV